MTDWVNNLESRGIRVARLAALAGIISLVGFALMVIFDVLRRWLLNSPVQEVADAGPLVMAIVVASTFPLAAIGRHNITINFLGNLIGPKTERWLGAFAAVVTTGFYFLFAWQFILYVIKLHDRGQTTWVLRWPVAPWWSVVAFLFVICAAVQIIVLIKQVHSAAGGNDSEVADVRHLDETPADGPT